MAEAKRGGQGFILQLDYCYSFSKVSLELLPKFVSVVEKTSDPKEMMFCKDSGQPVIS